MSKKEVRQVLHKGGYEYATPLTVFIKTLEEVASMAPEPDKVLIDIDSNFEYDSSTVDIEIYFIRLETDGEEQARVQSENYYKNQRIAEAKKLLGIST